MGSGEKKVAIVLVVILVALVGVYVFLPKLGVRANTYPPGYPGAGGPGAGASARGPAAGASAGGPSSESCAVGQSGAAASTQELGKPGAKLEIIAVLPVAHGCHANTEGELKKAYKAHPDDIHLTIVDLQGSDSAKFREKVGRNWTAVSINGKTSFELDGRSVKLEQAENGSYRPADVAPIIEMALKAAK